MTPQSVEDCLQSALSSLYPPFEVTAPTLLSQVFSVLERTYREDSLRYTLEFLIPAKRILQNVQNQACSQYSGFLFFHEGWPLCLGEKILVQLSSLPWHFLKPRDFYLQVVPYLECSPRLVLKCLSQDGSGVQEIVVPESSHTFLFSAEWLNSINKDRSAVRLENCLAAVEEKVTRLPWSEVIYPRFIHKGGYIVGRKCPPGPLIPPLESRSPGDGGITCGDLVDPSVNAHLSLYHGQEEGAVSPLMDSLSRSVIDCTEGEYVELSPPQKVVAERKESQRDTWILRAKTAPSKKGKKKANQAWLHPRRPGKVGSLSTLKGKSQDIWEEQSCIGATQEQESQVEEQSYWEVDATKCANDDLLAEWRKGVDLLQRHGENSVHSERQARITSDAHVWVTQDCTFAYDTQKCGTERNTSGSCIPEDEMLSKMLEQSSLKRDTSEVKVDTPCIENPANIFTDCQKELLRDSLQNPSEENQSETLQLTQRDMLDKYQSDCQVDSSKLFLTENQNQMRTHEETSLSQGLSLLRRERTWADGQETSKEQACAGEEAPSDELIMILEKEKHPTWAKIIETPHKTGRGRRKKKNKRGKGLPKAEVKKGAHKTGQSKVDLRKEGTESVYKSDDREDKKDSEERIDQRDLEETGPQIIKQSDHLLSLEFCTEPNISLSQIPLPQENLTVEFKCLYKDIKWDVLELGVFCLTGGQDKDKRAVVITSPEKVTSAYTQKDFEHVLLYQYSLLRPELRDLGMTLILDLRDSTGTSDKLLQNLWESQDSVRNCIHHLLVICATESTDPVPCDIPNAQVLVVLPAELAQFVSLTELPEKFGGERPYVHIDSVKIQRSLVNLYSMCSDVLQSLENVTLSLNADSSQDIQSLIFQHRDAMKRALTDERLQLLQRDGGTLVASLQKSPYLRLCDPVIFDLYERVDEALHQLVQLSNKRLQELEARIPPQDYMDQSLGLRSAEENEFHVAEPESRRIEVGVRIRGLEVSSRELANRTCSPPRGHVLSRGDGRGPDAPWGGIPRPEGRRSHQRLLLDLLCSERSYVQSLRRSQEVRGSCPAGLALRGSLEQLLNFHTHFLWELQNCVSQPLTVSYCFLQHADQLRLYSLYVKNKQKVELFLPSPSGSLKGRHMDQKEEEDSRLILQRPLEHLNQYQSFLGDMMHECGQENEQEHQSLHTARELVCSLVPYGKNLLAVEAIRGFEVDEKEHGRLLLKDVFTVISGRKKSLRHVFLFQKLLLLSKLKTADGGLENYCYKQSFKTADMGLTEIATEADFRLELWFRRQKSRETLVLQAEGIGVKENWTNEITKLLWDQGGLSKEQKSPDTSTIGSSHRSFLDIKAGFSAISERTVSALLTARGSRTRSLVALSSLEHSPSPSSRSLVLTPGQSPRRLRSAGGMFLSDRINEEVGDTFPGGPVCLKSVSSITEGEKPKGLTNEDFFPSTSV
ncbi:rho guanine nucleotide exchange factor 40 isoform X2 [Xenopus laevis]|uniref:Rho guanine nucleotide exchange factor 40 isoform X2 n=2 Tax=Xenopus laevis TaxID=8355 RepID=A0A1L8HPX5_XENLA|nr:rho guanine nucleotide exchange factor 40 isoform X2 [Xenopus laevis]OCT98101.1 hypothetical protein XELAEV_18010329mg [Xenopus laevis]